MTLYDVKPWLLKLWVPFVLTFIVSAVSFVELRLLYGFIFQEDGDGDTDGLF